MFWKCVIIISVILTTYTYAYYNYVNKYGLECHSHRQYLNMFIVKITHNSRLIEVRNLLAKKDFQYLRKIVTTYHSFRMRRNVTEGNCRVGINWTREFHGSESILSITQDYKIFHNYDRQKMSEEDRWANQVGNGELKDSKKITTNIPLYTNNRDESERVKVIVSDNGFDLQHPNLVNRINHGLCWDFLRNDAYTDCHHRNGMSVQRSACVYTQSDQDQVVFQWLLYDQLQQQESSMDPSQTAFRHRMVMNYAASNAMRNRFPDRGPFNFSHGTMVMGIIATESLKENLCNQGLCQHCELVGVKIMDDLSGPTDTEEALALGYLEHSVPVYSASYGAPDNKGFRDIREASNEALRDGVETGRQCKGRIYVVPIGNGLHDNCNMDGYAKSVFTITVAEVDERLQLPKYNERCPCVLAAAIVDRHFYTTDRPMFGTCRDGLTGSSFAVPAMSACIAEMLYINPDLSERDVKHIIVNSAITTGLDQNVAWTMNAAKRLYSDRVGFGVLNCTNMRALASRWHFVPEEIRCEQPTGGNRFHVKEGCKIKYLEHVQVEIKMCCHDCKSSDFGKFHIDVRSPGRTASAVMTFSTITEYTGKIEGNRCRKWTFMSVQFWGENPRGEWQVTYKTKTPLRINVSTRRVFLFGTEHDPLTTAGTPKCCGKLDHQNATDMDLVPILISMDNETMFYVLFIIFIICILLIIACLEKIILIIKRYLKGRSY